MGIGLTNRLRLWFIAQEFQAISEIKLISDFNMLVCKTSKMTTKIYLKIMIVKFVHQRVCFKRLVWKLLNF